MNKSFLWLDERIIITKYRQKYILKKPWKLLNVGRKLNTNRAAPLDIAEKYFPPTNKQLSRHLYHHDSVKTYHEEAKWNALVK